MRSTSQEDLAGRWGTHLACGTGLRQEGGSLSLESTGCCQGKGGQEEAGPSRQEPDPAGPQKACC